jgi:hypothetical protein
MGQQLGCLHTAGQITAHNTFKGHRSQILSQGLNLVHALACQTSVFLADVALYELISGLTVTDEQEAFGMFVQGIRKHIDMYLRPAGIVSPAP